MTSWNDVPADAKDPVASQLVAYNARDVDTFMPCFTDDVRVEDGTGKVLFDGSAAMRDWYRTMFADHPKLHCRVVSRLRAGEFVVDEEFIGGRAPSEMHLLVVYRLRGDRIAHVRLLR